MIKTHLLLIGVLLWIPITSIAAVYGPILEQIKPKSITFIGESHKKPESIELFQNLVWDAISVYHCVVIGLEIASDQQTTLDAVQQGNSSVDSIKLWPPLDHVDYRSMIENFAEFKRKGQCIKVIVIDAALDNKLDRDQWMALRLEEQIGHKPILVLLGAMHTLKKLNWTVSTGKPSVAELLSIKGFKINSVPQRWIPDQCKAGETRISRFVSVDSPEALTILNESLISLINATPPQSASGVVDGFLVWECA